MNKQEHATFVKYPTNKVYTLDVFCNKNCFPHLLSLSSEFSFAAVRFGGKFGVCEIPGIFLLWIKICDAISGVA